MQAFLFLLVVVATVISYYSSIFVVEARSADKPNDFLRLHDIELLSGRFDTTTSYEYYQYDWSGVQFSLSITQCVHMPELVLQDVGNVYNILLYVHPWNHGEPKLIHSFVLATQKDQEARSYDLSDHQQYSYLNPQLRYIIVVQKRTEALFGTVKLFGFKFASKPMIINSNNKNHSLSVKRASPLRIEFLGDSLSCGYGNEGIAPCNFEAKTENAFLSFPIVTANRLGANYSVTCWSGMGVVRNYGSPNTTSPQPFPTFYPRTLANNATSQWNFRENVPDIVVITLGTNDFSTAPRPSYEEFSHGYNNLISFIQNNYSRSVSQVKRRALQIFCVTMGSSAAYGGYTKQIVSTRADSNIHLVEVHDNVFDANDWGCNGHPNVRGDAKIAEILYTAIRDVIG